MRRSLDGPWRLGWFDGRRGERAYRDVPAADQSTWLSANVPGEVHRILEAHRIIAPIEEGLGSLEARWVDDCLWYFAREFVLEPEDLRCSINLVFDRLELDAQVFVNGRAAAKHRDAFLPLRVNLDGLVVSGPNTVRVELNGGAFSVRDLQSTGYRMSMEQGLTKRHWLRGEQYQFGWDWAPRLVTAGITGSVGLEFRSVPVRIDAVVPRTTINEQLTEGRVECRVIIDSGATSPLEIEGRLTLPELQLEEWRRFVVQPGHHAYEIGLSVRHPGPWWPSGMGDPTRYRMVMKLELNGAEIDHAERTVGFRSVGVDQSPTPGGGRFFRLVVNGRPFFAKGANWVPISLTPHPVDVALVDRLLDRAAEANFNLLRVWGGGDYESDAFYDGCDERGIIVWQDFAFACSRYPMSDPEFRALVTAEARHQVRRLASHPSLGVWAGNNEIAWLGRSGSLVLPEDGVTPAEVMADHEFFEKDLAEIVATEDPGRFYQPSSPWSPSDSDHNAFSEGDQHPWQIGFDNVDFLGYRKMDARFPNEGGLLGPPSLPAIRASLPEGQRKYKSFAWKVHDNEIAEAYPDEPMTRLLRDWTGLRIEDLTLEEYAYWTGLVQSEALTEYIDNFRRRSGTTGAAVFWMFNDCWPTVRSWSIVDYAGRRNPAFAPVKRAFAPVRVIVAAAADGADVFCCNDGPASRELELECGTTTLDGAARTRRHLLELAAGSTTLAEHLVKPEGDDRDIAFIALLRENDEIVSRSRLLGGPFATLRWRDPQIEVTNGVKSTAFVSRRFVLGVCLDLDGERYLDDNLFDLYPNIPHTVRWSGDAPPRVLFCGNQLALERAER
jgi:beta-mannosidase